MKKLLLLFCFALVMGQSYGQVYELTNDYPMSGPFSRFNGEVNAMSLDSNGKLLVGGDFTDYNGFTRNYLARLNADGTVDAGFDPGVSLTNTVYDITVHADNTVTVATVGGLKRFDTGGTEITGPTFVPDAADYVINVVAAEASGLGVIIAGSFTDVGGTTANGIGRLNADGTIDATFAANVGTGFNVTGTLGSKEVTSIEITSTGKILLGGSFTSFNSTTRNYIVLLNSDGTLDTNFDPGTSLNYTVASVAMQADGKILAGNYDTTEGAGRINRLTAAGVLEIYGYTYYNGIAAFGVGDIISLDNDKAILGTLGYGGLSIITWGSSISPVIAGYGIYVGDVNAMILNNDGSVIMGGTFSNYNGITSNNIAKVAICGVSIDTQPTDATGCEASSATFTVTASGTGTLTYQWQLNTNSLRTGLYTDIANDATYAGATSATLALTGVTSGMSGYNYRCIITDDNCSSTSAVKKLTVVPNDQAFSVDPVDADKCAGENATFSVTVTGTAGGYQWQEDAGTGTFVDIVGSSVYSGVNTTNLTIVGATTDMAGYKYRLISNLCAPAGLISASATLTVNALPVISEQPAEVTLCVSGDATFNVTATGNALTYQWQYSNDNGLSYQDLADNTSYSGVATANLILSNVDKSLPELVSNTNQSSVYFRCIITSNGCSSNSDGAFLYIHDTPIINTQPVNYIQCVNTGDTRSTNFFPFLEFEGSGMSFQWEYDDGNGFVTISDNTIYSGTSSRVLNLTNANATYNGSYRLAVGACSPTIYTDAALFTLDEKPVLTIVSDPNPKICTGGALDLEVSSTNNQAGIQWQSRSQNGSFTDITEGGIFSGTTSSILSITGVSVNYHFTQFRAVTTNGACVTNSTNTRIEVYDQPSFTNQTGSVALTVCDGGATVLKVNSNQDGINAGIMSYKWQSDFAGDGFFVDIEDGETYAATTSKNLSINVAPFSLNGTQYRCVIRGCITENASTPMTLTVLQLPLITASPQSQVVCSGDQVTFTAAATGSDLSYTWWRDSGDGNGYQQIVMSSYASPDYKFSVNLDLDGYKYKCIVAAGNCATTAESFEATLTVHETNITAVSEQSLDICAGETASFSVTMSNEEGLSFQWSDANGDLADGDLYAGVTTSTLTVGGGLTTASNNYTVSISGDCGNTTASFQLRVNGLGTPAIEASFGDSSNPLIFVTNTEIFSLGVDNFEWFLNGNTYQTTGSTASVTIDQAGSYTVIATRSNCEFPESNAAVVVITGFENSLTENAVSLYPNPVNNKLTLEMGADFDVTKESKIVLTNVSGKQVFTKRYNNLYNRKLEIDMSSFESGIYIVSVVNGNSIVQYKITKQ